MNSEPASVKSRKAAGSEVLRLIGLFLVTAFNFVLWYWTTTPQYAVMEIRDSIKDHNIEKFEKYVDIDSVATKMIDGLLDPNVRRALGNGVLGRMIGSGVVTMMKPQLVDLMKSEVTNFVERNDLERIELEEQQKKEQSLVLPSSPYALAAYNYKVPGRIPSRGLNFFKGIHLHLGFGRKSFRGASYLRQMGPDCLLGLLLYNERFDRMLLLELKLSRVDGQWRVTEWSNFPQFICTIIALERQRSERVDEARALWRMRQGMAAPGGEDETQMPPPSRPAPERYSRPPEQDEPPAMRPVEKFPD